MPKGSHATRGGWEPKLCSVCREPVRLSGPTELAHGGAFFRFGPPPASRHADCGPSFRLVRTDNERSAP
jgi:hypothetical protein